MNTMLQIFVLLLVMGFSCQKKDQNSTQGIKGKVLWMEGNHMPGPGREIPEGKPVERTVLIYPLTNISQAEGNAPMFGAVEHEPIQAVRSNAQGIFTINLPPGSYSIFTKEEKGLFANFFDGNNNIHPVVVKQGEFTEIVIEVNYMAMY